MANFIEKRMSNILSLAQEEIKTAVIKIINRGLQYHLNSVLCVYLIPPKPKGNTQMYLR